MKISQFEYFHGLVLTKLLRKDVPISLKLIETNPKESWATYIINDDVALSITNSTAPREVKQGGEGTSWTFSLKTHLMQSEKHRAYFALVCGRKTVADDGVAICLLGPEELKDLIDSDKPIHSVTVRKPKGKGKLIVFQNKLQKFLVAQRAIEDLEVKP